MDDSGKQRLKKHENSKYRWKNISDTHLGRLPKSAVLVALFERDGAMHVWLTKRSMKVRTVSIIFKFKMIEANQ